MHVAIKIETTHFSHGITADPASKVRIVEAIDRHIESALGVIVEASKVEIGFGCANHDGGAAVGIIIITSNHCAVRVGHLADRAEMITGVKVGAATLILSLCEKL